MLIVSVIMLTIDAIKRDIEKVSLYRHVKTTQDMNTQPPFKKPPLGIKPRKLVVEERAIEIAEAVIRFIKAGRAPFTEWVDELKEYIHYLNRVDYSTEKTCPKDEG